MMYVILTSSKYTLTYVTLFSLTLDFYYFYVSRAVEKCYRFTLNTKKHPPKEISKILSISLATVYRVIKRIESEISSCHQKGAGRPSKITNQVKASLVQQIRRKPASISQRQLACNAPINISKSTVGNCLRSLKYEKHFPQHVPMLSEKSQKTPTCQKSAFWAWQFLQSIR